MSLENFEDLTDVELRRKLLEYEFPNVPITETSRGFLVKKLKNHVKNLKSRKLSTKPYVKQRAQQELENLVTRANDWNEHSREHSPHVSAIGTLVDLEQSIAADIDAQRSNEVPQNTSDPSRERNAIRRQRTQQTTHQLSMVADNNSNGYLNMIWKILGLQENCTNSVWWCFTLFFLVITFMYVVKVTDLTKYINEENTNYVICDRLDPAGPLLRPPFICIDKERLEPALTVVRNLIEKLRIRSERHFCYDHTKPKGMSVIEFIRSMFEEGNTVDMRNLKEAQYLITCNPQWKIDMVDSKGNPVIFNGVDKILTNQDTYFVLKQPNLPLTCLLYDKVYRFMHFISNVAFIMAVIMLILLVYCYVRRIQGQRLMAVQRYLDNIIEELRQRAITSENIDGREVVVNHLRDQLIPVNKRTKEITFWNEALKKLEENESRVLFGITVRDGEEFRTMRWVDNTEKSVSVDSVDRSCERSTEVETNC